MMKKDHYYDTRPHPAGTAGTAPPRHPPFEVAEKGGGPGARTGMREGEHNCEWV